MNNRLVKEYICLLYPILSLIYLAGSFSGSRGTAIAVTFFLLTGVAGSLLIGYPYVKKTEDIVFSLYVLYNLLSGVWCVHYGIPVGVYVGEVTSTLLPMFFYYAGRCMDNDQAGIEKNHTGRYYGGFILAALISSICALICGGFAGYSFDDASSGSFVFPCISAFALAASLSFVKKDGRKDSIFGTVCALLSAVTCLLAVRRSFEGLSSLVASFSAKAESWIAAVNNMANFWMGDGLGSHGLRASEYQDHVVSEGGLVKLYSEMGLIGSSLIIFVVALVYIKSFNNIRQNACEIAIITLCLLISVGANVLDSVLLAPVVYFALGRAVGSIYPAPQDIGVADGIPKPQDEGDPIAVSPSAKESS